MNEYRCTRPAMYDEGSLGHDDVSVRQGHYIMAKSAEEAFDIMKQRFPADDTFDIQEHS